MENPSLDGVWDKPEGKLGSGASLASFRRETDAGERPDR